MVPLFNSLNLFTVSPLFVRNLNFPPISSLGLVSDPKRRRLGRQQQVVCFSLVVGSYSGFAVLRRGSWNRTWCCGCKGWESDGDATLEAEILEFMQKSEKPDVFPTKRELLDAGRMDLVEAIKKKGGWWSLGWESDDEDVVEKKLQETEIMAMDYDFQDFQRRVDSFRESNSEEEEEEGSSGYASAFTTTSQSTSSSGRSLEIAAEEDTGIEGILSRLEKQRNLSFGIDLGKGYVTHASTKDDGADRHFGASTIADRMTLDNAIDSNQLSTTKGINNNSGSKLSHNGLHSDLDGLELSVKPDMWRTWSIQRAGYSDMDFEAAEISYNEHGMEVEMDASKEVVLAITQGTSEAVYQEREINHNQIQNRLQDLELELASALCLLRSKGKQYISKEVGYLIPVALLELVNYYCEFSLCLEDAL
ncbi:unnamed protein product [Ilex paraguariensis]|uniref:Uncharacterized protein n=1 Tax=Ilex paraguariensis TaxID=185542 RepID=A0ABC8UM75_9AQUA